MKSFEVSEFINVIVPSSKVTNVPKCQSSDLSVRLPNVKAPKWQNSKEFLSGRQVLKVSEFLMPKLKLTKILIFEFRDVTKFLKCQSSSCTS